MNYIIIGQEGVSLTLTMAMGKIRIADEHGNHIKRPTVAENIKTNFVEWMITNNEIEELTKLFLDSNGRRELIEELGKIKEFIKDSKYATRESIKTTTEKIGRFADFDIHKYTENFYSFENELSSKIKIRITFKMGDYTLAPHLFVLLPFNHNCVRINNAIGKVAEGKLLGPKCCATWNPTQEEIIEIVKALAHASSGHRDDLVKILKS